MQIIQRYNIHIDVCHSFKGVWLDRREIDKIGRIQSAYIEEDDNKNHYKTMRMITSTTITILKIDREREAFLGSYLTSIRSCE